MVAFHYPAASSSFRIRGKGERRRRLEFPLLLSNGGIYCRGRGEGGKKKARHAPNPRPASSSSSRRDRCGFRQGYFSGNGCDWIFFSRQLLGMELFDFSSDFSGEILAANGRLGSYPCREAPAASLGEERGDGEKLIFFTSGEFFVHVPYFLFFPSRREGGGAKNGGF